MKRRIIDRLLAAGARVLALAAMAMGGALTALGDIGDLAGAADQRLAYITNAADYAAFEGWMQNIGIGLDDATNSPNAWASYALDASGLINPQDGDVAIVSLETVTNGTFTLEVAVSNVLIGSSATPKNLASVFEVEGTPSLTEPFSSTNVTAELGVSANGRLLVVAKPAEEVFGSAVLEKFFVRVQMHAEYDDWFISINGEPPTPPDTPPVTYGKVQLWAGGPYWAETNIGAEVPWESGCYFWWGDTIGYRYENNKWVASDGSSDNFSFIEENVPTFNQSVAWLKSNGFLTEAGALAPAHDAAQKQWGGAWRMPTERELTNLVLCCTWTWTTTNGVNGYIVRGKDAYASASIFLPAAGYGNGASLDESGSRGFYWPSVPRPNNSNESPNLLFHQSSYRLSNYYRYRGFPIRPVQSPDPSTRGKVQLWEKGPYWAETNIGAGAPWETGYYFWWGDTVGYEWVNGKWVARDGSSDAHSFDRAPTYMLDVATLRMRGWITADGVLSPIHDAAQVQWGGGWRMPTALDLTNLVTKCTWTWTKKNSVNGYVVRGKGTYASASIFLPTTGFGYYNTLSGEPDFTHGYFWSSVPLPNDSTSHLFVYSSSLRLISGTHRDEGFPIRPVKDAE